MNAPKREKASFSASDLSGEIMTPYKEPHSSFIRTRLFDDYHPAYNSKDFHPEMIGEPVSMATLKDDYHPAYNSRDFHPEMIGEPISLAVQRIHNRHKYHSLVQ